MELHPNVMDLGAGELLKKCFFGSTQWFESVQLPQVGLLWFYKSQGKGNQSRFKAMVFTGPQNQFWFVDSSTLAIFQQMQKFKLG